jgi:hypothetical protein
MDGAEGKAETTPVFTGSRASQTKKKKGRPVSRSPFAA